jgi:hypothetical protein
MDKLQRSVDMSAKVRFTCEWNFNRYIKDVVVTNGTTPLIEEFDHDSWPLSSIVEPDRPRRSGIAKLILDTGMTLASPYTDPEQGARATFVSDDDKYKYYLTPLAAGADGTITKVAPQVVYGAPVMSNKIHVLFEIAHSTPTLFTVEVTTDGTNWATVATNPVVGSDGSVRLYRQTDGSWGSAINYGDHTPLRGVRVVVTKINKASGRLAFIELGLRRIDDLSAYVKDYSTDLELSDTSILAPIGKATSNEAKVSLDNTALIFNNDNASSPYYQLMEPNAEVRVELALNKGTAAAPEYEFVTQFTGVVRSWPGQGRSGTSVEVSDSSTYLQSIKPPPMMLQNVTAAEIIWRIMDSVGFSSWEHDSLDIDSSTTVPVFWCDGETTAWEVISQVSEVFQCAVFFDENNVCQIMTKRQAYIDNPTSVWQFDAVSNGSKLPDIVEAEVIRNFEANVVNIEYTPTAQSEETAQGVRPMEVVWEPEDNVVLRSTQLSKTMGLNDQYFYITQSEAMLWPYSGMVQVEGEFIKYDAKEYSYYNASNSLVRKHITSEDERAALDKINPNKAYLNGFTGAFRVPAGGRACWASVKATHDITASDFNLRRYRTGNGPVRTSSGPFIMNPNKSVLTLKTNTTFTPSSFYAATMGSSSDPAQPIYYGTRMMWHTSGYTWGAGGIVIGAGTNESGFYIDLQRSSIITPASRSKYGNELQVFYKNSVGAVTRTNKGASMTIEPGVWYDIDVKIWPGTSSRKIDVSVNGIHALTYTQVGTIPSDNKGARCGLFVRGNTGIDFEYFYSSSGAEAPNLDNAGWFDRIKGGYQSNQYDYEWSYGQWTTTGSTSTGIRTTLSSQQKPVKGTKRYMNDFGPIVHEVREFDVKFEKSPVTYSMVHFSNESQVACPEFNSDSFGAKFVLTNISRENAVVKGEDALTLGVDNPVDQSFIVYGRTFLAKDSRKETVEDKNSIKKRGRSETSITSPWIQSEDAAKKLGEWIVEHWSDGAEELS